MARPQKCRRICSEPEFDSFSPSGKGSGDVQVLTVDEYEAVRLIDYEGKTHEQCAGLMDISRTTVTEMYESARYKIADCIVNGKSLSISGGNYRLCRGAMRHCCGKRCSAPANIISKGDNTMRIAVTYDSGSVFQHFGHTEQFKLYDVENGVITAEKIVDTMGSGHGALAEFLFVNGVSVLICGGIGGGAKNALAAVGIRLYGGVSGSADEAVKALLEDRLTFDPDIKCSHHSDHEGEHHCGEHKHGCGGNHCG